MRVGAPALELPAHLLRRRKPWLAAAGERAHVASLSDAEPGVICEGQEVITAGVAPTSASESRTALRPR
jgi:hypothetical protein